MIIIIIIIIVIKLMFQFIITNFLSLCIGLLCFTDIRNICNIILKKPHNIYWNFKMYLHIIFIYSVSLKGQ
jgi:hypothetical protein